jgi:hypothetical protein
MSLHKAKTSKGRQGESFSFYTEARARRKAREREKETKTFGWQLLAAVINITLRRGKHLPTTLIVTLFVSPWGVVQVNTPESCGLL